ncbi:hypothetical protein AB6A40_009647 [Gnathostoma spinigerum]|uniref:Large ribosomal subunit protein eL34 n=1 Tax=Gnathostoma spinigerum TaxID=75299 RepID=A0ABD6ESZ1_9BILA
MPQRLQYRRRLSYHTTSNKTKVSKTPGGRLVFLYRKKSGTVPRCGDTGVRLKGITPARPRELARIPRRKRTVSRAYGGCLSAGAVRERIIRAFLIEEEKIATRVLRAKKNAEKK